MSQEEVYGEPAPLPAPKQRRLAKHFQSKMSFCY